MYLIQCCQTFSQQRRRAILMIAICCSVCVPILTTQGDDRPLEEQPYVGVSLRHDVAANKCLVSWIYPGPLNGTGFNSDHLTRGEYLLQVGEIVIHTPDEFKTAIAEYTPGESVRMHVQRTNPQPGGSVPKAGDGTEVEQFEVTLDSRANWSGPVKWLRDDADRVDTEALLSLDDGPTALEQYVNQQLEANNIRAPIDDLVTYFNNTLNDSYGFHMLDRVAYGFRHPTRLAELQMNMTVDLPTVASDPRALFAEISENIDLDAPAQNPHIYLSQMESPKESIDFLEALAARSHAAREAAFSQLSDDEVAEISRTFPELVSFVAQNFYINDHPDVQRLIAALKTSMRVDFDQLLGAAANLSMVMQHDAQAPTWASNRIPLPNDLMDAIKGDVIGVRRTSWGGWAVVGGAGDNEYDLSKIDIVIEVGGQDSYRYSSTARPDVQIVIDFAGNDVYAGNENDSAVAGPASALGGINLLVDHAGNDTYKGGTRSCGVGIMGFGVLVDHGGADTYTGKDWSCGAGFYGSGAILDLGSGSDVYTTEHFSQAIGGPRGFGLILDENGRDLYRNNGPVPSVYGSDAVYSGISQGIGFGVRGYDTGGIGILCDLAGHDRYEAGEFSQGGGYYWGLGVLYDRAGRDLYYGNRYTQGFAAHQALGILADDQGDDTYWGMTAATQSGSWDICATLLIDRQGNDTYQADGLAQGGASMQAIAWLIDLEGNDRYNAPVGSTMGQSGGNSYHYEAAKCFSFSLLLDAGGSVDMYSRDNCYDNLTRTTGSINEDNRANSSLHGLFIDTAEQLDFWP